MKIRFIMCISLISLISVVSLVFTSCEDAGSGSVGTDPAWLLMGDGLATNAAADQLSLAVINGTPYFAFSKGDEGNRACVKQWDKATDSWEFFGSSIFSSGYAMYTSLVEFNGYPALACMDVVSDINTGVFYYSNSIGDWNKLGGYFTDTSEGLYAGWNPMDAIVHNGITLVGYINEDQDVLIKSYNSDPSGWVTRMNVDGWDHKEIALTCENGGEVFAAISRLNTSTDKYDLIFRHGTGTSTLWTSYGNPGGIYSGNVSYLTIDVFNGTPYIAFVDEVNGDEATIIYWSGDSWDVFGTPGFTSGTGAIMDLTLKIKNMSEIYLSYNRQGNRCYVEKWNGTSWTALGGGNYEDVAGGENTVNASGPAMVLDGDSLYVGVEAVVFVNSVPSQFGAAVLRWGD